MHALCGRLPALTWVDLEGVKSLTAGGLRAVGGLTAPTWLHLSDCSNVGMGCSLPLPTAGRVLVWPHGRGKSHHLNSSHPPTPACTHPSTLQCSPVGQLPMLAEEEEEDALEEEGVTAADRPSKAKRRDSGVLPPNNPPRAAPRSIPRAHPSSELSFTQLTHTHTHTHHALNSPRTSPSLSDHPLLPSLRHHTSHSWHPRRRKQRATLPQLPCTARSCSDQPTRAPAHPLSGPHCAGGAQPCDAVELAAAQHYDWNVDWALPKHRPAVPPMWWWCRARGSRVHLT